MSPTSRFTAFLLGAAARRPDHPAVVDAATGRSLTYGDFAHQIERAAAGFAAEGPRARATSWRSSPPTRPSGSSPATARSRRAAWSAGSTRSGPPTRSPRRSTTPAPGSSSPPAPSRRPHGPPPRRRASARGWCCSTGTAPDTLAARRPARLPRPGPGRRDRPGGRPRAAALLQRHHRPAQGRDAHPPRVHRQRAADRRRAQIGPDDRTLAVAPFSHAVGWGVVANCALAAGRRSSPSRGSSRTRSSARSRSTGSPRPSSCRRSCSRWPATPPSPSTTCPR